MNICWSPLTEGILRPKLPEDKFIVNSVSTWYVGQRPDAQTLARKSEVDICSFIACQFNITAFLKFGHIYVINHENHRSVIQVTPDENLKDKVRIILNYIYIERKKNIPNPSLF